MKFKNRQKKLNVKEVKEQFGDEGHTDRQGHLGASGVLGMSCILIWLVVYMCMYIWTKSHKVCTLTAYMLYINRKEGGRRL